MASPGEARSGEAWAVHRDAADAAILGRGMPAELKIAEIQAEWRLAALEALRETAAKILEDAIKDCPYDPAYPRPHLRETGKIEEHVGENATTVSISFTSFYAKIQHEHTEFKHKHGGRAKFLERNLTAHANELEPTFAAHERRVIGP